MANELAKYTAMDGTEVTITADDVRQKLGCPHATDKDLALFAAQAKMFNANPWADEIYLTGYNGKDGWRYSVILSYHIFNRIATKQEDYDGIESGIIVGLKNGGIEYRDGAAWFADMGERLLGGWAKVYRKGISHPFTVTMSRKEYDTGRAMWKSKPGFMCEKTAKAQAWRLAYPSLFSHVYESAEMGDVQPKEDVEEPKEVEAVVEAVEDDMGASVEAKQAMWAACKRKAGMMGKMPIEISDEERGRASYRDTDEWYLMAANELNAQCDEMEARIQHVD